MFKRLKRLIQLSKKDPKVIEALTEEQIEVIPNEGDGKAVFFSSGTQEEFEDLQKEDTGMRAWFERLKNL